MSIRFADAIIRLESACLLDDATVLLDLLVAHPDAAIDLGECDRLHMAVAQILLAVRPPIHRPPTEPFLRDLIVPLLLTRTE